MPKQETIERFKITAEVEAISLGPTVAALARLGLTNIGYELVTEIRTFNKKTQHETKAEDHLRAWIVDRPSFSASDVVKAFLQDGRTAGAAYSAMRRLVEQAVLTKTGPGSYARSDVKQLAAPAKKAAPKKQAVEPPAEKPRKEYDIPAHQFILRFARRNHGKFSSASVKRALVADGRPATTAGPTINKLLNDKLITRISEGQYETVPVNKLPKPPKPPAKTTPAVNGHDVTEGTANG
jgi:hypothetical protein